MIDKFKYDDQFDNQFKDIIYALVKVNHLQVNEKKKISVSHENNSLKYITIQMLFGAIKTKNKHFL